VCAGGSSQIIIAPFVLGSSCIISRTVPHADEYVSVSVLAASTSSNRLSA